MSEKKLGPRITSKWERPKKLVLTEAERQIIETQIEKMLVLLVRGALNPTEESILLNIQKSMERERSISAPQLVSLERMCRAPRP